jgi:putative ABC transport system permease protein
MLQLPRSRGVATTEIIIDGREPPRANEEPVTDWQAINPAYFTALGVPLVQGRGLEPTDRADTQPVAVVNQRFVDVFLAGEDVVGRHVTVFGERRRIVGVSGNVFQTRLPREGGELGPIVYLPMAQHPMRTMSLAMRASGEPASLAPAVRAAIWAVDPDQPVTAVQTLTEHIDTQLAGPRTVSVVLGIFGATALLLSAIGIYGVMAHSVVQRKREIGIRMALGAASNDVVGLVTRQGLRLAAIGIALGAPMALAIVRAIHSMILVGDYGTDWGLIGTTTACLLAVAFTATFVPALGASRLHPVRALQAE